jgi:flagellar motor switch protein FliN/FliY
MSGSVMDLESFGDDPAGNAGERRMGAPGAAPAERLSALYDIPVRVSAVLGRTSMPVSRLLRLGRGAVVELDSKVGDPVEIYVNDRLIARGEVLVLDDRLGISMTEIVKGAA